MLLSGLRIVAVLLICLSLSPSRCPSFACVVQRFFSCFASHPATAPHHVVSTHFFPLTLSCLLLAIVSSPPFSKQSKWRHCVVCVRACVCDISFLGEDEPCTARTFTQRITNTHPHKESQILTHTTRAHTYTQTQTYTRTQTLSSQQ